MEKLGVWINWIFSFPFKPAPREPGRTRIEPLEARHRITGAANIWAIGMVMYQLVTLDEPNEVSKMVDQMDENTYMVQDGRILRSLSTKQHPDYSEGLFKLILECLTMTPEKRPTPKRALEKIDRWLQEYHEYVQMDLTMQEGPKVFYKGNSINYMTPGGYDFELSDHWWRRWFNRHEVWLDERWGRLRPPYRPEQLDPWPKEKHDRDEVLVPDSAQQRENQRAKRRKTNIDGDVLVDTEMKDRVTESQPIVSAENRMFTFPHGFPNPPKRNPMTTPLPPEIVNPRQPGIRERFRNVLSLSGEAAGSGQSPAEARQVRQRMRNLGHQQQDGVPGPY